MDKSGFIKAVIRNETSKTKGRTISLYWTKSLEAIPEFLKQRESEGAKPTDYVLTRSYNSLRAWIQRFGKKVLHKRVHVHMFRHACADWLASKLNRQQLCIFFGWKFSSNMPDIYISRQNVNMQVADEKIKSDNFTELQNQITKIEFERKMEAEKHKEELAEFKEKINNMLNMRASALKAQK